MADSTQEPKVGVGVILLREGRVLLGQRLGSHGEGSWALPGGHLDFGETPEECAAREVMEETGMEVHDLLRGPYTNDFFFTEGKQYITLFVLAHCTGEPQRLEPNKCGGWAWFHWENLPQPLFAPLISLIRTGFVPEDLTLGEHAG